MSLVQQVSVWGPRLVVGACGLKVANDYVFSVCFLPDGVYAVNKMSLLRDSWLENLSNDVDVACIDPFDRHKTIVRRLVGKNGEWVKFSLLPEDSTRLLATATKIGDSKMDQRDLDKADYTAFVPKGYCWVHATTHASAINGKQVAATEGQVSDDAFNDCDELEYIGDFDSRKFGPISIGLVKGVATRLF